jgi:hypothetical protein
MEVLGIGEGVRLEEAARLLGLSRDASAGSGRLGEPDNRIPDVGQHVGLERQERMIYARRIPRDPGRIAARPQNGGDVVKRPRKVVAQHGRKRRFRVPIHYINRRLDDECRIRSLLERRNVRSWRRLFTIR